MEIILDATVKFSMVELKALTKLLGNHSVKTYETLYLTREESDTLNGIYGALVASVAPLYCPFCGGKHDAERQS